MKLHALAAIAFLAAMPAGVQAQSVRTFLCVGELSTGFKWSGAEWVTTNFHVRGDQFAVKIDGMEVSVTRIGNSVPSHTCSLPFADAQQFACGGLGLGFMMNITHLRYQDFYGIGYVDGSDDTENTPATTIGKCSPL